MPPRPERRRIPRRGRPLGRRAVVLALAAVVIVTALVFAAFSIPGSRTHVPGLGTHRNSPPKHQLVLSGIGRGTYVEVRRKKASGKVDLQGTVGAGESETFAGDRFYLLVRRPAGLRITLDGRAVSLPAVHDLRVLVTPKRTTRLRG